MLAERPMLTMEEVESQAAFELPERDMMLVTIVITNVLNNNTVEITLRNIDVAVQVCANALANNPNLTCEIQQ